MSYGENGEDRNGAWVITTDRWRAAGCYMLLPVNPEQIEIKHELRADEAENKRGKIIYISREHSSWGNTLFKPFQLAFNINSGNIIPQFSDDYKQQAYTLSRQYIEASSGEYDTVDEQGNTVSKLSEIQARIASSVPLSSRIPGNMLSAKTGTVVQTADHRRGTQMNNIRTHGTGPNIPKLYNFSDVPIGIQNLYAFIMLAEEPAFYRNSPNKVHVHINTLAFPNLTLSGTLVGNLHWKESVESFGSYDLDFTLQVVATTPRFGYGKMDTFFRNYSQWLGTDAPSVERMEASLNSRYLKDTMPT